VPLRRKIAVIKVSLNELAQAIQGQLARAQSTGSTYIKGVSVDSRSTEKDNLFVALKGEHHDGHDFIKEAAARGASCVMVKKEKLRHIDQGSKEKIALLGVDDTQKGLQDLASWYRKKFKLRTVAVTGSNGKTTTKDMIASVLSRKHKVIKSPKSYNTQIGVPLTIFELSEDREVLVVELGASMLGEIEKLTRLSEPDIGVITNIAPAHLEFFGSFENIVRAKMELLENMPDDRTAVLNCDDESLLIRAKAEKKRVITFGIKRKADFRAYHVSFSDKGEVSFVVNEKFPLRLKLIGRHNVYGALAAFAVGSLCQIDPEKTVQALQSFTPPDLRMELEEFDGIKVLNDSYNANPASMESALETLKQIKTSGRRIAILGDMLELGEESQTLHQAVGEKVFDCGVDILVTVGKNSKWIARAARERGLNSSSITSFEDKTEVSSFLRENLKEGDLVLVKGSRKMKLEDVVESLKKVYAD